MAHYAEGFAPHPGACFRYVVEGSGHGRPTACPAPAPWRGALVAPRGVDLVDACQEHVGAMTDPTTAVRPSGSREVWVDSG